MRYFHPTCASRVLGRDTLDEVLLHGHATTHDEHIDYQLGCHYPRECAECAGIITSDQGMVSYERKRNS